VPEPGHAARRFSRRPVPGFDSLGGVLEWLLQNSLANGPDHQAKQPPFEVLAFAYDDHVNVGQTVGTTGEEVVVGAVAKELRATRPKCTARALRW